MTRLILSALFFMFITSSAFAMQTSDKSQEVLQEYGASLAVASGAMHWQQLWKRTREAGAFNAQGDQPRFTQPMIKIPELVSVTLSGSTDVQALYNTQAIYRRDFSPHIMGVIENQNVTSICVTVNWKPVSEGTPPSDRDAIANASMLIALPCK